MNDRDNLNQSNDSMVSGIEYQVQRSDALEDPEWDAFVASLPHGHHVQTSLWAQVKGELGWRALRIKIQKSGEIIAGTQIMVREIKPIGPIGYAPKGPLFTQDYCDQLDVVLNELLNLARSNKFRLIAAQPPEHYADIEKHFNSFGFSPSWLELVPTATIHIDLSASEKEILAQMKRQTRQNINRSEREGIKIREGGREDIHTFYQIHQQTSLRQKFTPYPEKYFIKMWDVLAERGNLVNIIAEYEGEAVSCLLIVPFGQTVIAKVLGWSGNHPEKRPNDAAFWGAISWAKNHNYQLFDMEGIHRKSAQVILSGLPLPDVYKKSPDFFKLGYGGQIILLPSAYDYVPNPIINWIYRIVFRNEERKESIYSVMDRIRRRIG